MSGRPGHGLDLLDHWLALLCFEPLLECFDVQSGYGNGCVLDSDPALYEDVSEFWSVDQFDGVAVCPVSFSDGRSREVSCGDHDSVGIRGDAAAKLGDHARADPASHALGLHGKPDGWQSGPGQGPGNVH